jgi:hypothetical protein
MLDALEQRRARDGVVLRMVRPPVPAPSLDALAELYEAAIGPRTRLVLLTHPSNLTGQLLPVRRIAAAAHRAGAEVVVDGAQSLGLLDDPGDRARLRLLRGERAQVARRAGGARRALDAPGPRRARCGRSSRPRRRRRGCRASSGSAPRRST